MHVPKTHTAAARLRVSFRPPGSLLRLRGGEDEAVGCGGKDSRGPESPEWLKELVLFRIVFSWPHTLCGADAKDDRTNANMLGTHSMHES
jgi:hypothetical protein